MTWLDSTSCWWSGVPVGGRRTKPEASTAAEEPAHGVHAPAEDVLAKRPNWQAGRLVWEGGRHGPARGLRQFGGVDLALLTFVLPLERLDGHVPGVLLRPGRATLDLEDPAHRRAGQASASAAGAAPWPEFSRQPDRHRRHPHLRGPAWAEGHPSVSRITGVPLT